MQVSDRIDYAGECRQARCQHQEERFDRPIGRGGSVFALPAG